MAATIFVLMRKLLYSWCVDLLQRHRIRVARREKVRRRKRVATKRRKAAEQQATV